MKWRAAGFTLALALLMAFAIRDMAAGVNAPPRTQDIRFFSLDQLKG